MTNTADLSIEDFSCRSAVMRHYVPNDRLRYTAEHMASIEPETLDWIDGFRQNAVFFDIGASSGPFSLYAAIHALARVTAFEPEAQNYAVLEMNHYLNRDRIQHPIVSLNVALSDRRGLGKIFSKRFTPGEHQKILDQPREVIGNARFDPAHVQFVAKDSLDSLVSALNLPIPNYVKIDVDGSENDVLCGASQTLRQPQVESVLIELVDPHGRGESLVRSLLGCGFRLTHAHPVRHPHGHCYPDLFNCVFERGD